VNDNGAVTNYTYNAANQIANPGFSYDAAGRMTSDGVNTYTWDRADRLLSMGGVQNAYNGLGQRVQQSVGAQVMRYLLDVQPELFQILAATTSHDASYHVCSFSWSYAFSQNVGVG
jgi:hypothetical protein